MKKGTKLTITYRRIFDNLEAFPRFSGDTEKEN